MKMIDTPVSLESLWEQKVTAFDDMMKIVVDISREVLAIDAEMHADLEQLLLMNGSHQQDLWGANIYPSREMDNNIEYTSLINIRPALGNRSMEVKDPLIQKKIKEVVAKLLHSAHV
ncbi:MAG: hypothetical protein JXA23_08150 [Bacteroidales bacterium]|nr:hypothetical protein [Bacteroidales bacterium]